MTGVTITALSAWLVGVPTGTGEVSAQTSRVITLKAVGDIMPGTNFPRNLLPRGRGEELLQKIGSRLTGADVLFGNFESTLTTYPRTAKNTKRKLIFAFRTPPKYARTFREAGFNVLSVANNHSHDFYPRGYRDTIRNIRAAGMTPVGERNRIEYVDVKGVKIAFIGFGYTNRHNNIRNIRASAALVRKAAKQASIVILSMHAGAEGARALHTRDRTEKFYGENRGNLVRFSRAMIRNGADLVLGHGPHVPRALELYRGRLVAYSLGNFIGYRMFRISGPNGLSLILDLRLDEQGQFLSGQVIPVRLRGRGVPEYDPQGRTIKLMQRLIRADFPRTPLRLTSSGKILRTGSPQ